MEISSRVTFRRFAVPRDDASCFVDGHRCQARRAPLRCAAGPDGSGTATVVAEDGVRAHVARPGRRGRLQVRISAFRKALRTQLITTVPGTAIAGTGAGQGRAPQPPPSRNRTCWWPSCRSERDGDPSLDYLVAHLQVHRQLLAPRRLPRRLAELRFAFKARCNRSRSPRLASTRWSSATLATGPRLAIAAEFVGVGNAARLSSKKYSPDRRWLGRR